MPLTAITRPPSDALQECIVTHIQRSAIDLPLALVQHAAYCAALRAAGVHVITLPAHPTLPDAPFVEDTAIVLDELAILTHPGMPARRPEIPSIAAALAPFRTLAYITPPGTLEGGDILHLGQSKTLLVGLSARTNRAGFEQLQSLIGPQGYTAIAIPVDGFLHLKSAVSVLDSQTLLLNPQWFKFDAALPQGMAVIHVAPEEPFAANTLTVNGLTLISASHPRTGAILAAAGRRVQAQDISEFEKAEAGHTCLSLIFNTT